MTQLPITILVASVGTSVGPLFEAINKAQKDEIKTVFLVYGRAHSAHGNDPFSIATQVKQRAIDCGLQTRIFELADPENLDESLSLFTEVLRQAEAAGAGRFQCDFTGGTKVMAAAFVHTALSGLWSADVVFQYVGGTRGENGRVKDTGMTIIPAVQTAIKELGSQINHAIRQKEYSRARYLSENLPKHGRWMFLYQVSQLLWYWDNCHYADAYRIADNLIEQARVMVDEPDFSSMATSVIALRTIGGKIKQTLIFLEKLQKGIPLPFTRDISEGWLYILGDNIANARRRCYHSPADAVLRSYRAIEITAQIGAVKLGVNPWKPDWQSLLPGQLSAYLHIIKAEQPPKQLSLWNTLKYLELLTTSLPSEIEPHINDIMYSRNYSYLEHGYLIVSADTAQKNITKMEGVVEAITSMVGVPSPLEVAREIERALP